MERPKWSFIGSLGSAFFSAAGMEYPIGARDEALTSVADARAVALAIRNCDSPELRDQVADVVEELVYRVRQLEDER